MTEETHFSASVITDILSRVECFDSRLFVVVLDGPGGSGKSTLARQLAERFSGSVAIVQGDDFYADLDEDYRASLNAEGGYREYFDWGRLREQVFVPAHAGETITYQRYDWVNARMGGWITVPQVDLLVVEGVYSSRPELRDLTDLVVWVTTSESERMSRQIARRENEDIWIKRWMAAENWYLDNVHKVEPGDIVVVGE